MRESCRMPLTTQAKRLCCSTVFKSGVLQDSRHRSRSASSNEKDSNTLASGPLRLQRNSSTVLQLMGGECHGISTRSNTSRHNLTTARLIGGQSYEKHIRRSQ